MTGLDKIRDAMALFLAGAGVRAKNAWPRSPREVWQGPVAAVELRAYEDGPAGAQDYLGERFNEETGRWEELFGKRAKLTFGLDIYAREAQACPEAFNALSDALAKGGPEGLTVKSLSCGQAAYHESEGLFICPVQAECEAFVYAIADEEGQFFDFEVRGGVRL